MPRFFAAILLLVLAGCASGGSTTFSPAAGSSATTGASSSDEAPQQLVSDIDEPLEPGRYTHEGFTPATSFEVGPGWFGAHLYADFYDVQVDPNTPDVVAVQLARPSALHTSVIATDDATTAAAAAASLASNETLEATAAEAVTVGGHDGVRLTVTARLDAETPIMEVAEGTLSILADRRLEITFVNLEDGLLAILLGGSVADWERAIELGHPVIATLRVGS
ncbi:MAG: hypothetical protein ABI622_10495 [Chloroflexota bacterium]